MFGRAFHQANIRRHCRRCGIPQARAQRGQREQNCSDIDSLLQQGPVSGTSSLPAAAIIDAPERPMPRPLAFAPPDIQRKKYQKRPDTGGEFADAPATGAKMGHAAPENPLSRQFPEESRENIGRTPNSPPASGRF
jgi:hypothetical protein